MPVYEYQCNHRGHCLEYILITRSDTPSCEACGGQDLRRLLSTFATRLDESSGGSSSCSTGAGPTGICSLR